MEPITGIFTLIPFIITYIQEKNRQQEKSANDLQNWLSAQSREDLKNFIAGSQSIQDEINILLREEHSIIIEKIEDVQKGLSFLISKFDGSLQPIASSYQPILSPQAKSILQQMVERKCMEFRLDSFRGDYIINCVQGGNSPDTPDLNGQNFLVEDCNELIAEGYLLGNGSMRYRITRDGITYAKSLCE